METNHGLGLLSAQNIETIWARLGKKVQRFFRYIRKKKAPGFIRTHPQISNALCCIERSNLGLGNFALRMTSDTARDLLLCLRCKSSSSSERNKLLVCFEEECPVVLHEQCLPAEPQIDDKGNFCCPYCALRRFNLMRARNEKNLQVSAARLADWIWMATEEEDDQRREEGENDVANDGVSARHDFEDVEGGERQEEREPLVVEPLVTVRLADKQGKSNVDEGLGKRVAEEEEEGHATRKLPKSLSLSFVPLERRRILWTKEEEEALKVGVRELCNPERKNIPWEKILRAYKDIFHSSRTAANLKDKWTRMTHDYYLKNM